MPDAGALVGVVASFLRSIRARLPRRRTPDETREQVVRPATLETELQRDLQAVDLRFDDEDLQDADTAPRLYQLVDLQVAIIGCGVHGIDAAAELVRRGCKATLWDAQPARREAARAAVLSALGERVGWRLLLVRDVEVLTSRLSTASTMSAAVGGAHLIVEAVPEDPSIKRSVYTELAAKWVELNLPLDQLLIGSNTLCTTEDDFEAMLTGLPEGVASRVVGIRLLHPRWCVDEIELTSSRTTDTPPPAYRDALRLLQRLHFEPIRYELESETGRTMLDKESVTPYVLKQLRRCRRDAAVESLTTGPGGHTAAVVESGRGQPQGERLQLGAAAAANVAGAGGGCAGCGGCGGGASSFVDDTTPFTSYGSPTLNRPANVGDPELLARRQRRQQAREAADRRAEEEARMRARLQSAPPAYPEGSTTRVSRGPPADADTSESVDE